MQDESIDLSDIDIIEEEETPVKKISGKSEF